MFSLTRRLFLQMTAATVAGLGLLRLGGLGTRHCPACGTASRGHAYRERNVGGVYCPGCAINLASGTWDVIPLSTRPVWARMRHARRHPPVVPFPNAALVASGAKPAVALSAIRVFRVRGAAADLVLPKQGMAIRHARVNPVGTDPRAHPTADWRHLHDATEGQSDVLRRYGKRRRSSLRS
jgi:hypothetical protein